jgi:phosphonatase-like hydrolase
MEELELVVFDLAGTTIQDRGEVAHGFFKVLAAHGIPVTEEALRAVRGSSKREVIHRFVEQRYPSSRAEIAARSEQIFEELRGHLARVYQEEEVRAIPGAVEVFHWLHRQGAKVAFSTGFDRAITEILLRALGWDKDIVDAVVCSDDVVRGRPAPYMIFHAMEATRVTSVHCVVTVGDTVNDLQAGWHAGVRWNIGVLTGAHRREQLEQAPHTHLLPSIAALPALLHPRGDMEKEEGSNA